MGRLPKAVVSTMNGSATGSYVCLTGGMVDQGLAGLRLLLGLAVRPLVDVQPDISLLDIVVDFSR